MARPKKGFFIPNTLLFNLLKDAGKDEMRSEIVNSLMELTQRIYPHFGLTAANDCVFKVLYGVAMDCISSILIGNLSMQLVMADRSQHLYPNHDPFIAPLNVDWQREKCSQLKMPFIEPIKQPTNFSGCKLRKYLPWQYEDIAKDGNCLFRCLSKIISGSQYHPKIRGEIVRFIAKYGKDKLQWYFDILKETRLSYLLRTLMDENGSWRTEVEILAASAILEVNIYVASECNTIRLGFGDRDIKWNRYCAAPIMMNCLLSILQIFKATTMNLS